MPQPLPSLSLTENPGLGAQGVSTASQDSRGAGAVNIVLLPPSERVSVPWRAQSVEGLAARALAVLADRQMQASLILSSAAEAGDLMAFKLARFVHMVASSWLRCRNVCACHNAHKFAGSSAPSLMHTAHCFQCCRCLLAHALYVQPGIYILSSLLCAAGNVHCGAQPWMGCPRQRPACSSAVQPCAPACLLAWTPWTSWGCAALDCCNNCASCSWAPVQGRQRAAA